MDARRMTDAEFERVGGVAIALDTECRAQTRVYVQAIYAEAGRARESEDLRVGDVVCHKSYPGSHGVVVFTSREPLQVHVQWDALPGERLS